MHLKILYNVSTDNVSAYAYTSVDAREDGTYPIIVDSLYCPNLWGRYANDHVDRERINAYFDTLNETHGTIVAERDIAKGEEIFIDYGDAYWTWDDHPSFMVQRRLIEHAQAIADDKEALCESLSRYLGVECK